MADSVPFVVVKTDDDLRKIRHGITGSQPTHVFLETLGPAVLGELARLSEAKLIYSVSVQKPTYELSLFGLEFDWIPIFVARDRAAALDVASRLAADPHNVVYEAINGDRVATFYGRGSAT